MRKGQVEDGDDEARKDAVRKYERSRFTGGDASFEGSTVAVANYGGKQGSADVGKAGLCGVC